MKIFSFAFTAVAVISFAGAAQAGCGCGGGNSGGNSGFSGGLINVSPSIDLGQLTALNGILSDNNILSGNLVSGVLNGNKTNVVGGLLSGIGVNLLGANSYKLGKRH